MKIRNVVTCREGWKNIYNPIIEMIIEHDNTKTDNDDKIGVGQVKEKWGALEILPLNGINVIPTIRNAIIDAYTLSMKTCEFCGETNNVGATMNHWTKTCCMACWEKEIVTTFPDSRWKDLKTKIIYNKENKDGK